MGKQAEDVTPSSLPDLIRQSIFFAKWMDARVKPGHDDL
jgi:hypothetical protein